MIQRTTASWAGTNRTVEDELHESFTDRFAAVEKLVRYLAFRAHQDEEDVVAEVRRRAWTKYPSMVRAEQEARALGCEFSHDWRAYWRRTTLNLLANSWTRQQRERRRLGERAPTSDSSLGSDARSLDNSSPSDLDDYVHPNAEDPADTVIRKAQLALLRHSIARLPNRQRTAVENWKDGQSHAFTAGQLNVSVTTAWRDVQRALVRLRSDFRRAGYDVPHFASPAPPAPLTGIAQSGAAVPPPRAA